MKMKKQAISSTPRWRVGVKWFQDVTLVLFVWFRLLHPWEGSPVNPQTVLRSVEA